MARIIYHDLTPRREEIKQEEKKKELTPDTEQSIFKLLYKQVKKPWVAISACMLVCIAVIGVPFIKLQQFAASKDITLESYEIHKRDLLEPTVYRVCKDELWGMYDVKLKKEIISPQYDNIGYFYQEKATFYELKKKFGYVNREGIEITPAKYDNARAFASDRAAVCLGGKWGFINTRGEEVIELKYDEVKDFYHPNHQRAEKTSVRLGKEWITIDRQGRKLRN